MKIHTSSPQHYSVHLRASKPVFFAGDNGPDKDAHETPNQDTSQPKTNEKKTLYLLHAGMNDPHSGAFKWIQPALIQAGVSEDNVVIIPNSYPRIYPNLKEDGLRALINVGVLTAVAKAFKTLTRKTFAAIATFGIGQAFLGKYFNNLYTNINLYRQSGKPDSDLSQSVFQKVSKTLKDTGTTAKDKIIWIGHSAGGQMGITMAEQLTNAGYNISKVITLGSPIFRDKTLEKTKIVRFISDGDWVLKRVTPLAKKAMKDFSDINDQPCEEELRDDNQVRSFKKIGHRGWLSAPNVLYQLLQEVLPKELAEAEDLKATANIKETTSLGKRKGWRLKWDKSSNPIKSAWNQLVYYAQTFGSYCYTAWNWAFNRQKKAEA